jgi:hypothetical protein
LTEGVVPFQFHQFDGDWFEQDGEVIEETFVSIFVNGQELATIMSTPRDQGTTFGRCTFALPGRAWTSGCGAASSSRPSGAF